MEPIPKVINFDNPEHLYKWLRAIRYNQSYSELDKCLEAIVGYFNKKYPKDDFRVKFANFQMMRWRKGWLLVEETEQFHFLIHAEFLGSKPDSNDGQHGAWLDSIKLLCEDGAYDSLHSTNKEIE